MISEKDLIERLRSIERLFEGATTDGERSAAENALERVRNRLREAEESNPAVEYKFTFSDSYSQRLFLALLRRYGLRPYRYRRQRHTTVMVRVSGLFVDQTLWPEFEQLNDTLRRYLGEVTERVIGEGVFDDSSNADVVADPKELSS